MEQEISQIDYQNALEIVVAYHNQIARQSAMEATQDATKRISAFLQQYSDIPVRIKHNLLDYIQKHGDIPLDDVQKKRYLLIPNAGKVSWRTFEKMSKEYLSDAEADAGIQVARHNLEQLRRKCENIEQQSKQRKYQQQ